MLGTKRLALVLGFVLVPWLGAHAADETLLQAKKALDNGNPQAAYSLLVPLQSDRAGDPEYDFLLGSAALQLGRNTEAVFALERVLAVNPEAAPARALIARAYFNLKENETAKREFENLKKQEIPAEVALTIDRFLDAIERVQEAQRVTIRGYIEIGGGYDSNVNSATAANTVAVPAFGGTIFTLAASSQEQADGFLSFGGGVGIRAPITKRLSAFGGVSYQNKSNIDEDDFSTYSYDLNVGVSYKLDRDTFTLAAQVGHFYVDNPQVYRHAYREAGGATAQWQHDFNARNQLSAFAQYTNLRYPDQHVRDAERYVGGLGFAHAFGRRGGFITYLGGYGGSEQEKDERFPQFGHDLYGLRVGAQQFLSEKFTVFMNASAEKREYGGPDPFFSVDREDKQYNAAVGLNFTPIKNMRVTPQATWTENQSNIAINEFDRWVGSVNLRYDF
jgi:outer membrane protein